MNEELLAKGRKYLRITTREGIGDVTLLLGLPEVLHREQVVLGQVLVGVLGQLCFLTPHALVLVGLEFEREDTESEVLEVRKVVCDLLVLKDERGELIE